MLPQFPLCFKHQSSVPQQQLNLSTEELKIEMKMRDASQADSLLPGLRPVVPETGTQKAQSLPADLAGPCPCSCPGHEQVCEAGNGAVCKAYEAGLKAELIPKGRK